MQNYLTCNSRGRCLKGRKEEYMELSIVRKNEGFFLVNSDGKNELDYPYKAILRIVPSKFILVELNDTIELYDHNKHVVYRMINDQDLANYFVHAQEELLATILHMAKY